MGIAASKNRFPPIARQQGRGSIVAAWNLSIQYLQSRKEILEKAKVQAGAASRQAGENVVDTEENLPLAQIGRQRRDILAAPLELEMVPLVEAIDANMNLRAAGRRARHFLAQK